MEERKRGFRATYLHNINAKHRSKDFMPNLSRACSIRLSYTRRIFLPVLHALCGLRFIFPIPVLPPPFLFSWLGLSFENSERLLFLVVKISCVNLNKVHALFVPADHRPGPGGDLLVPRRVYAIYITNAEPDMFLFFSCVQTFLFLSSFLLRSFCESLNYTSQSVWLARLLWPK